MNEPTPLSEIEERYRDIFDNTSDLIQCLGPDGRFLYTNRAWRETLGYSEEEVRSLTLDDVLHPDCRQHCLHRFRQLKAGESVPHVEFKFVTRSGETVHLRGECGSLIKDGKAVSTRGIFRNITGEKRAEQALRASEARYQLLYDNAPDIYSTVDTEGMILSINRNGAAMLGYAVEELTGRSALQVIHPDDHEAVLAYMASQFERPVPGSQIEYRKLRKDGSVLWVQQRVALAPVVDGDEQQLLIVCRDITETRKLSDRLAYQATHDELTDLVNRREFERRLARLIASGSAGDAQ
ncbi:MAG TPA: PAS domain S-box protein, partial [Gammaproteobacteria bacterium]|nr:PAS domain S-box protein [Gammaproteobacteria bacterium]